LPSRDLLVPAIYSNSEGAVFTITALSIVPLLLSFQLYPRDKGRRNQATGYCFRHSTRESRLHCRHAICWYLHCIPIRNWQSLQSQSCPLFLHFGASSCAHETNAHGIKQPATVLDCKTVTGRLLPVHLSPRHLLATCPWAILLSAS
jgi:hypothetical protein